MGWGSYKQTGALKPELESGLSLGPSEKVKPDPWLASDF